MDFRSLDVTIISADDIKNVNLLFKMSVYVVVSILGQSKTKKKTHVHRKCGTSPRWNHRLKFAIDESALSNCSVSILFQLKCDRFFRSDKDIGEVSVPVHELLSCVGENKSAEKVVDYQVRTPSGKPKGTFKFSYKFAEKIMQEGEGKKKTNESVTCYATYPQPGYAAFPPFGYPNGYEGYHPSLGYGGYPLGTHGYPPPPNAPGFGFPYPPPGYGNPPPMHQVPQSDNKGMGMAAGLGLGLAGGLVGGMVIGETGSHVGEMGTFEEGHDCALDMGAF